MLDPFGNMRKYLTWTFILIIFLIISGVAIAQDYKKIIPILVSCVKEKQKKINKLKMRINQVKDYIYE